LAIVAWLLLTAGGGRLSAQEISEDAREALTRATTAIQQQQWLVAEQQLKIASDKSSNSQEVIRAFADFNDRRGGRDLIGIALYRDYLAARPDAPDSEEIKAKIAALEQRALSLANGFIDKALSATSGIAAAERGGVLINIAIAQALLGNLSGAFSTASSARASNPNGDDPYGKVAQALAEQGNLAAANDALGRVAPSKRPKALADMAYTLSNAKRPAEALNYAAQSTGPDRVNAYDYVARGQSQLGDRNAVRSALNMAISAANSLDQASRRVYLFSVLEAASDVSEPDIAKRLYADGSKLYNAKDDAFQLMVARWHLLGGLANAGHIAEAQALLPSVGDPRYPFWHQSAAGAIENARKRQADEALKRAEEFVKRKQLPEAEASLGQEPWPGAHAKAALAIANAYLEKKDLAAAKRVLDLGAVGLAKAAFDPSDAFNYTVVRRDFSNAYVTVGDPAMSRRILDALAATIGKIAKPDQKQYPLDYTAGAFVNLAKAFAAVKNFPAAKGAAVEVFKLANQMSAAGNRASALGPLADLDPQVGIMNELAAALPALPGGYPKNNIIKGLIKFYAANHQDSQALAMAARLEDVSDRMNMLSSLISARASAKDWSGAMALANEPSVSGRLYAEIAGKMLSADMRKEAADLEQKFGAPSSESNSYFGSLASRQASAYEIENAVRSAFRIAEIPSRIRTLFSIASTIEPIAGRAAAKPIVERAIAQFSELKTPVERADTCNNISSYLAYGSVLADESSAVSAENSSIGAACAAEALEIPAQDARISKLQSALYSPKPVTRPIMGKTLVPTRLAISRLLAQARSDSETASATSKLAQDGAIESALDLAGFPQINSYSDQTVKAAIAWLMEFGDAAAAERIFQQFVDAIAGIKDESSRDSRQNEAAQIAKLLPDLERALDLVPAVKSATSRISLFIDIGNEAVSRGRFEIALNALERAKATANEIGNTGYFASMASLAARAGDKNAEAYIAEVAKANGLNSEVDARYTLIEELLKAKQRERATALLAPQEAALARLSSSDRWGYRALFFARQLAILGDTARLDKLIAAAPLPENKVSVLLYAAYGFENAERPDAAVVALTRALEMINDIADPATKVSDLQSIAGHYITAGKPDLGRANLAKSIELIPAIPAVPTRSSYLRSAASTYARLGDTDAARKLFARSLEILGVNRPDLAAWTDYQLAIVGDSAKESGEVNKRVLAISDSYWRARAVQSLISSRVYSSRVADAITLIKSAPPSALLDADIMKIFRLQLGKHDTDPARELIGKIAHPGLRDEARRLLLLVEARQAGPEAALADIGMIENKATRAYTFVDLGRLLASRSDKGSQAAYFAQLAYFVGASLAEQVSDISLRVDLAASTGAGQNALEPDLGKPTLARAETLAAELSDQRARTYAVRWAKRAVAAGKAAPPRSDERNEWASKANSLLYSDEYKDIEGFVQSLMSKNPTERANGFAQAARDYGSQVKELRDKEAAFEKKRQALAQ
jgi:hypothetical protein